MNRLVCWGSLLCAVLAVASVAGEAPICNASNSWEVYRDPSDCAKFYRCEHKKAVSHTCVENTLYDHQLRACNWEHLVNCEASPNLPPSGPVLACPMIEDDPNRPTHLEHPTDCGKFYKCWDGVPVLMDCPAGFYWNSVLIYCDFPRNVPCGNL